MEPDPKVSRPVVLAIVLAAVPAAVLAGCSGIRSVGDVLTDAPAWERYATSLEEADLDETALGREWIDAGARALREAPQVEMPYREAGYLAPDRPGSAGYRLFLRRGQRLAVEVLMQSAQPGRVFLDLFRAPPAADSLEAPEHVAGLDADSTRMDVEISRDADYILRLQPELLRGGRYEITIRDSPTLAFPVEGAGNRDIGSGWGDPRDGGSRSHRGIDIFADRGTPALAVAAGRVRTGTNRLGGNTVWLTATDGDRSFYYAHLDRQAVRSGDRVVVGDTVGWVGNTGNASTTVPHLHFGVRLRGGGGYVDAYPYVARTESEPEILTADTTGLGGWIRTRSEVNLRSGPGVDAQVKRTLPPHTVARALAGTAGWYRVELPDRNAGFLWAPLADDLDAAVDRLRPDAGQLVFDAPSVLAAPQDSVGAGEVVPVLGRFGGWALVRAGERDGWMLDEKAMTSR